MDFKVEVLEESKKQPVLVDFWAPWCGPCKYLGPVLEELDKEAEGKWKLVKVNTDENKEISQEYGIRGIPDVKLFVDGKPIAEFTGALPKFQVEKWLKKNLPDNREKELQKILEKENDSTSKLEDFVKRNPDLPSGFIALAEKIILKNPELAEETMKKIPAINDNYQKAQLLLPLISLMKFEKQENEIGALIYGAKQSLQKEDFEQALKGLIEAVKLEKSYYDELARKASIALFSYLGPDHEITKKFRRSFDMALY
jgi:putative thioredoxin